MPDTPEKPEIQFGGSSLFWGDTPESAVLAWDRENLYEITLVVNGPLDMSAGKIAGQAFQAAMRACVKRTLTEGVFVAPLGPKSTEWVLQGTRTIVRVAKTPAIFERVLKEVPGGFGMYDEGFTEVQPGDVTVYMTPPYLHKDRPAILNNKKLPLL